MHTSRVVAAATCSSAGLVLGLGPRVVEDTALVGLLAAGLVTAGTGLHHLTATRSAQR